MKLKLTSLILFFCILNLQIKSQTGATCATAITLTITPGQSTSWETTALDTVWYSFSAPNNICDFKFNTSMINKRYLSDVVYGACGNFPNGYLQYPINDSTIGLHLVNLTSNSIYKLGLVFSSSGNCTTCSAYGVYKLDFVAAIEQIAACTSCTSSTPTCNFICNGDFEQSSAPPQAASDFYACNWSTANGATPDLFSIASPSATSGSTILAVSIPSNFIGCENVHLTGNNYAGFFSAATSPNFFEGMMAPLTTTLTSGKTYALSFWLSLADNSSYNVNNIAFAFTNTYTPTSTLNTFGPLTTTPINTSGVSKVNWTNLTYTFTSNGTESKFLIGAIGGSITTTYTVPSTASSCYAPYGIANSAYYYIDDISVKEIPTFSVTPSNCYTLTTISVIPSTIGTTYTWTSSPATPTLSTQNSYSINVTPTTTTTYSVSTTTTLGCIVTNTISTILPVFAINSSTVNFCSSNPFTTTITVPGLTTYTWTAHPTITGSLNNPTITVSPTTTTIYSVVGNIAGCSNTYSATVTLLDQAPTISISTSSIICAGTTVTVSTSFGSNFLSLDFLWFNSNMLPLTAYTYSTVGNYTIEAYSEEQSSSCYSLSYFPITVVASGANPSLTITPSQTICAGQSATLAASGASSYTWNPGSIYTSSIVVTPAATTIYTVIGSSGCGIATATSTVTVVSNPTVSATASPTSICTGNSSTLSASGATSYTWQPGSATTASTVVSPTITTIYTVTGTNNNGCSNAATVTVNVITNPVLVCTPSSSIICPGSSATLTANAPGATSYSWNPGAIIGATIVVTPSVNTTYTAYAVTSCGTKTNTILISTVSAPVLSISPSATICSGTGTTFTAGGATSYTWNPGSITGYSIAVTAANVYTVTGANACTATSTQTVKLSFFKGNAGITASASPTFMCAGSTSTLTMSGTGTINGWLGQSFGLTGTVSPSITTTYTASSTNSNGCSTTSVVTVSVGPFTSITANPASICSGNAATLTASGATTYTWYPGGTVHTATFAVSPSVTSNYTVTGSSGSCATSTVVLTVTVNPSPIITVNSPTICTAGTATLTASGGSSYTWSPVSSNSTSIAVTPTVTTNYTVSGTSALGCTATAISTVNISNGSIPSFSIVSPTGTICASANGISPTTFSTSLGTTAGYGFLWTPGLSTSAAPSIAITQPVNVQVTVTNLACNTSSVQDICVNYVSSSCCNSTLTTLTNTVITDVSQLPNTMYRVVGTLTLNLVSTSLSLGSKEFLMSSGSKITVTPTTTLQINGCKFYSCSGMWYGIELQNTASAAPTIRIDDLTTIEDAYLGLSAVGGATNNIAPIIHVGANTTFNKNYVDVYLTNWLSTGNTYPFETIKTNYTSQTSTNSPGGNLKCSQYYTPTIKSRSAVGIYALTATSVNVSSSGNITTNANYFNNKDYGVFFEKTSGLVTNAFFSNMAGAPASGTVLPTGVGVMATTNSGILTTVSVTTVSAAVTFSNVQCAVYAKNLLELTVLNTIITNPVQSNWALAMSGYGYNGIYTADVQRVLHLNYNTITNAWYGVQATHTGTCGINVLSISNNTISATTKTTAIGINISSAAVNGFNGNPAFMPVAANTLSNVATGVQLTGLVGGVRVSGNTITMRSGNSSFASGSAIYLAGGNTYCKIDNNTVYGNSTGAVNTYTLGKIGINIKLSTGCLVQCNRTYSVGTGVRYDGNCLSPGAGFFSNTITYPTKRGLELKNSASLGTQGTYTGTPPTHTVLTTSANQWAGTWSSSASDQTWINDAGSNAGNSRLCTGTGSTELPTDNQWNSTGGASSSDAYSIGNYYLLTSATATANTACSAALTVGAKMAGQNDSLETILRDEEYKRVITQSLTDPMIPDESKWQLKNTMYTTIANGEASQDATVQSFYTTEKNSSIGEYTKIDSLINAGNYNQAASLNASASASLIPEQATKDYNTIWLSKFSDPDYAATSSDIADIQLIANLCIHKGGNSVAYARALLGAIYNHPFEYDDECMEYKENSRKAQNIKSFEAKGNNVNLYPNPNNGNFTLSYQLIDVSEADVTIEDVTGKLIYTAKLNVENRSFKLNLNNVRNGIYFVKVMNNKKIISVNKLVIHN